jgi:hypothetical protein
VACVIIEGSGKNQFEVKTGHQANPKPIDTADKINSAQNPSPAKAGLFDLA